MQKLVEYKFEANALFLQSCLKKKEVFSEIEVSKHGLLDIFTVVVAETDYNLAKQIVEENELDESKLSGDSEGYLQEHVELHNRKMVSYFAVNGGNWERGFVDKSKWKYVIPMMILPMAVMCSIMAYYSRGIMSIVLLSPWALLFSMLIQMGGPKNN